MKHGKKRGFFGALLLAAVCGAVLLSGPRTALLENEKEWDIPDGRVPLSGLPEAGGEDADWREGLEETEITQVEEVLRLVNEERVQAGLEELELDPALCAAAQVRAEECVGSFSHTRPDGSSYRTALSQQGVEKSYVGENVATGYPDARRVVEGWMKSEGHRANILNASCCRIGIGLEENAGNRYRGYAWCQLFTD